MGYLDSSSSRPAKITFPGILLSNSSTRISYPVIRHSTWLNICFASPRLLMRTGTRPSDFRTLPPVPDSDVPPHPGIHTALPAALWPASSVSRLNGCHRKQTPCVPRSGGVSLSDEPGSQSAFPAHMQDRCALPGTPYISVPRSEDIRSPPVRSGSD